MTEEQREFMKFMKRMKSTVQSLPGIKSVDETLQEIIELKANRGIKVVVIQGLFEDGSAFSYNSTIKLSEKCMLKCMMEAEITDFLISSLEDQ